MKIGKMNDNQRTFLTGALSVMFVFCYAENQPSPNIHGVVSLNPLSELLVVSGLALFSARAIIDVLNRYGKNGGQISIRRASSIDFGQRRPK
jgi:hypothetical protein